MFFQCLKLINCLHFEFLLCNIKTICLCETNALKWQCKGNDSKRRTNDQPTNQPSERMNEHNKSWRAAKTIKYAQKVRTKKKNTEQEKRRLSGGWINGNQHAVANTCDICVWYLRMNAQTARVLTAFSHGILGRAKKTGQTINVEETLYAICRWTRLNFDGLTTMEGEDDDDCFLVLLLLLLLYLISFQKKTTVFLECFIGANASVCHCTNYTLHIFLIEFFFQTKILHTNIHIWSSSYNDDDSMIVVLLNFFLHSACNNNWESMEFDVFVGFLLQIAISILCQSF